MKRRDVIAAIAAAGVAVTAGLYRFTDLFVKHYAPTPYDDLLSRLTDREQAAKLGSHLAGPFDPASQAARLRATFRSQSLAGATNADAAAGRMVEIDGWVLPESLALLAALAGHI